MPPAGIERNPAVGVTAAGKSPEKDAVQKTLAGAPLATTTSWSTWVDAGARVALGRNAVTGRGGIQSRAAAGAAIKANASAVNPARKKRGPAARTAGPPTIRMRTGLLQNRDLSVLHERPAHLDPGVIVPGCDGAAEIVMTVPDRRVWARLLGAVHERPHQPPAHVVDPQPNILGTLIPRDDVEELRDRVGGVGSAHHEIVLVRIDPAGEGRRRGRRRRRHARAE